MITPTKYMDLDLSVVRVSSIILKQFGKNSILGYGELFESIVSKVGEDVKHVFVPALDFLYLLGKIDYHLQTDSIELLGEERLK